MKYSFPFWAWLILLGLAGCIRVQPEAPTVTPAAPLASPPAPPQSVLEATPGADADRALIQPTLDPVSEAGPQQSNPAEYLVQPGDTLSGVAALHGLGLDALLEANADLPDPNILIVGQILRLPELPELQSVRFKIIPENRLVRGPGSSAFDVIQFVSQQPGYIRSATDEVDGLLHSAGQLIERVSLEFSVDARLLLALLELRSRWLTNPDPTEDARIHPLGAGPSPLGFERDGLYRQLTWAADQLNAGYYGVKYGNLRMTSFADGQRVAFAPGLNTATIAVQFMLSHFNSYGVWREQISPDGLYRIYVDYFGDPFIGAQEPLVPPGIVQPSLALPFAGTETWFYTGGPHGGWGSGSAWAAIDFGPPDDLTGVETACYVSNSWARAVAPGIIARIDTGVVVLDLDGDGDEATGWSILYLHLSEEGRIAVGTSVNTGDALGRPSCEGGFSNGTHLHIARRYNGEWIPADCSTCRPDQSKPAFVLGDWLVVGLAGQEYQGFMRRGGEERVAEQGRLTPINLISW